MNMKKEVSPAAIILILGIVILVIGYAAWRILFPPDTLPPLPPELRPGAIGPGAASPAVPAQRQPAGNSGAGK